MDEELEKLRTEIAALRRELAEMRADRVVHHYHHQAGPAPFVQQTPFAPAQRPIYPGGPYLATCGKAIDSWGVAAREIEGGTDFGMSRGPNAP